MACHPDPAQVITGIVAVIALSMLASWSAYLAFRGKNWLHLVTAAGAIVALAGIVGQRAYPSNEVASKMVDSCGSQVGEATLWHANLVLPIFNIGISGVTMGGLVLAVAGFCLVLLLERQGTAPADPDTSLLEDADAV